MAHRRMIVTETLRYGTRMLQAGDKVMLSGPKARFYEALGKVSSPDGPPQLARRVRDVPTGDITALRAAYTVKVGKKPYYGWDAATLREKIASA